MLTHIRRDRCSILATILIITRKIQPTMTLEGASLELKPKNGAVRAIVKVGREGIALDVVFGSVVDVVLEVIPSGNRTKFVSDWNATDFLGA